MKKEHYYRLKTTWTGNLGSGTSGIMAYERSHTVVIPGKPELHLTTDNKAVGDGSKLNPEDLLVAALSSCHMLSYLYLCAKSGVIVTDYADEATGVMEETITGHGHFTQVTLRPVVIVADAAMKEQAIALHDDAHGICFIASSVNFAVKLEPVCRCEND